MINCTDCGESVSYSIEGACTHCGAIDPLPKSHVYEQARIRILNVKNRIRTLSKCSTDNKYINFYKNDLLNRKGVIQIIIEMFLSTIFSIVVIGWLFFYLIEFLNKLLPSNILFTFFGLILFVSLAKDLLAGEKVEKENSLPINTIGLEDEFKSISTEVYEEIADLEKCLDLTNKKDGGSGGVEDIKDEYIELVADVKIMEENTKVSKTRINIDYFLSLTALIFISMLEITIFISLVGSFGSALINWQPPFLNISIDEMKVYLIGCIAVALTLGLLLATLITFFNKKKTSIRWFNVGNTYFSTRFNSVDNIFCANKD